MKNDGYTGRNFNRPGFQAMLAEAEAGKIGTIIVKDMSRFCRNYLEVGFYTEILFPKKQIRFIAINNSVDSDKPQNNDFTPFLNIMNEWYAKDTSNKISRARTGGKAKRKKRRQRESNATHRAKTTAERWAANTARWRHTASRLKSRDAVFEVCCNLYRKGGLLQVLRSLRSELRGHGG